MPNDMAIAYRYCTGVQTCSSIMYVPQNNNGYLSCFTWCGTTTDAECQHSYDLQYCIQMAQFRDQSVLYDSTHGISTCALHQMSDFIPQPNPHHLIATPCPKPKTPTKVHAYTLQCIGFKEIHGPVCTCSSALSLAVKLEHDVPWRIPRIRTVQFLMIQQCRIQPPQPPGVGGMHGGLGASSWVRAKLTVRWSSLVKLTYCIQVPCPLHIPVAPWWVQLRLPRAQLASP